MARGRERDKTGEAVEQSTPAQVDDLAQLLETTARAIAGVLRRPRQSSPVLSALSALSVVRTLHALVDDAERALVALARQESHTWQEIADALGVTRQAAHQRFSGMAGEQSEKWPPGALEEAARVVHAVSTERFAEAGTHFDDRLRLRATPSRLEEAWRQVTAHLGPFLEPGQPTRHVTRGIFVVDTPLRFERGLLVARTALRADGQVAGFFLLRPEVIDAIGDTSPT